MHWQSQAEHAKPADHTIMGDMNRAVAVLLSSCILIAAGLYYLNPAPLPEEFISNARIAAGSAQEDQPYRAIAFYQKNRSYQPYSEQILEKIGVLTARAGDYPRAVQILENILTRADLSDEGFDALGFAASRLGEIEKAVWAWNQVEPTWSGYPQVVTELLDVYSRQERWQDAVDLLEMLVDQRGEEEYASSLLFHLAFLDVDRTVGRMESHPDLADEEFSRILSDLSIHMKGSDSLQTAEDWLAAGGYLDHIGQPLLALHAYRKAVNLIPESGLPLAYTALQLQQLEKTGRQEIGQAIEKDSQNAQVNRLAAMFWEKEGKPEIALVYATKAIQLEPSNPDHLKFLGSIEITLGNIQAGLAYFTQAASITPEDPEGWLLIARYCLEQQVYIREQGLPAVRKAILADEEYAPSLDVAGQIYMELDDAGTARQFFERALSTDPDYYPAQLHLGIWYLQAGSFTDGLRWLQSAANQTSDPQTRDQALIILSGQSTP